MNTVDRSSLDAKGAGTRWGRRQPVHSHTAFTSVGTQEVRVGTKIAKARTLPVLPVWFWTLLLMHLPLGILMKQVSLLPTVHGVSVLCGGGIWIACSRRPFTAALMVAYISGAEVLWRISGGSLYWEFGKISVILFCLLGVMKSPVSLRACLPMVLYFLALVPGVLFSAPASFSELKRNVSLNFSGPAALTVVGFYFSGLKVEHLALQKMLFAFLLPLCSLSVVLLLSVATATELNFTGQSNFIASGGFGPVQVSSALAGGCLLGYFYSRLPEISALARRVTTVLVFLWLGQAALTFSRSGVYIFLGSALVSAPLLLAKKNHRRTLLETALLCAVCCSMLVPLLLNVTGGKLQERFANTHTTGRADMAALEWQAFKDHPIVGVGMGNATRTRSQVLGEIATSHTELTRLLSEHGLFGAFALFLLIAIPASRAWTRDSLLARVFIISSAIYSILFMATCGMRLVVVAFIYGLVLVRWTPESFSSAPTTLKSLVRLQQRLPKPLPGPSV